MSAPARALPPGPAAATRWAACAERSAPSPADTPPSAAAGRLRLIRQAAGAARALAVTPLGGLLYGACVATPADAAPLARVPAAPLPSLTPHPVADLLHGDAPVAGGRTGCVAWRHDGHWLFGHARLSEEDAAPEADETPLEATARGLYGDVFATLAATGFAHLHRLWNYVPRINEESHGLERYRQFNAGRQRAFLAAGQSAFAGAPAACALGAGTDGLWVSFLAGRAPSLPVENPRQVSAYHYPREFGPRSPTFSRAALSALGDGRLALFVSGTASIVGHRSLHEGDIRAQTREAVANLRAVVGAADARCGAGFSVEQLQAVVYLRRPADAPAVREVLAAELGVLAPLVEQAVWLQADVCRRELLVEIEGHAVRPAQRPLNGESAG